MKKLLGALLGAAVLTVGSVMPAQAVDFSGQTISWIIPFREGGGSDKWARFWAPRLAAELPGNPNVVVQNIPGAGSTTGANFFQENAKPDGLTLMGTSGSTQFPYLLNDPRVKYEYRDWNIVLATPTGGVAYIDPSLGVNSAADLKDLDELVVYGSQGATSLDLVPLLAFELLGLDVEPIFGLRGRSAGRKAFQQGETNIDYQTTSSYLSNIVPMVESGKAVALMSWGSLDADGNIVRDPTFPDLPSFAEAYDMVHGEAPSGPAFEAWKSFFTAGFPAQKMVFLPNGTPQEIIDTFSNAFKAATERPDFAEASKKRLGVYKQLTGADAQPKLEQALTVSPEAKAWVFNWLDESFGVKLN